MEVTFTLKWKHSINVKPRKGLETKLKWICKNTRNKSKILKMYFLKKLSLTKQKKWVFKRIFTSYLRLFSYWKLSRYDYSCMPDFILETRVFLLSYDSILQCGMRRLRHTVAAEILTVRFRGSASQVNHYVSSSFLVHKAWTFPDWRLQIGR